MPNDIYKIQVNAQAKVDGFVETELSSITKWKKQNCIYWVSEMNDMIPPPPPPPQKIKYTTLPPNQYSTLAQSLGCVCV